MPHDNIALVRRWFEEIWNQRRPDVIDELLTGESVCHAEDGPIRGPGEFKERQYDPFTSAFPDLRVAVEAIIGQDDVVVVRWSAAGTHSGDGLGFRATRASVSFRGLTWVHVRDGKMVEGWQSSNIPEVIRGLSTMSSGVDQ
jgi:predicted ester cyclase